MQREAASLTATCECLTHLKTDGRSVKSFGFSSSFNKGAIDRTTYKKTTMHIKQYILKSVSLAQMHVDKSEE